MRRRIVVLLAVLFAACSRSPVSDEVTIELEKNDRVRITAQTTFNDADLKSAARLAMVEAARFAALHETDDWSARFGRVNAEDDEVTFRKHRGQLDRVTRSIRVTSNELPIVFSDTNITVNLLNGPGWRELAFYPGGSVRATREQRRHFEDAMVAWSAAVARYYTAIDRMYAYMDAVPIRAQPLFAVLLDEKDAAGELPIVAEEEEAIVNNVLKAMEDIADRLDAEEEGNSTFGEEADLIYNPFPARMTIRVPGDVISTEGFSKELVIEPIDLLEIVSSLEGKWISPDPLATILRDQTPTADGLSRQKRRTTKIVRPSEIADAIREQLTRPKNYVVRWRD